MAKLKKKKKAVPRKRALARTDAKRRAEVETTPAVAGRPSNLNQQVPALTFRIAGVAVLPQRGPKG